MKYIGLLMALMLIATNAMAIDINHLPTPELQARYKALTSNLRCLVCQGESIANSNSKLAIQLRNKVRDMLVAGKTNEQIIDYMVERYSTYILYKPPVQPNTWLLWFGPFVLLLGALGVIAWIIRQRALKAAREAAE